MESKQLTRRRFMQASSNMVGCAWLTLSLPAIGAAGQEAMAAKNNSAAYRVLSPAQALAVDAVAAQIIPTDDSPGAREAGVIYFIDNVLQNEQAHIADIIKDGAQALDAHAQSLHGKVFIALASDQQIHLLQSIEETPFFELLRFLTLCGMFANPSYGGNQNKVGWDLLGFKDQGYWQAPFGYYDAQVLKIKG
ncbi:gluconate 2-dehydrogenase subunit 3 family protein [Dasania marina]|uniref:gluconate 2-dehydrogenase subunit 3 family protein n=1 Tax=Dasania marina TaxID=471499 RepID=UPI0030D6D49A|tara:strand:+ start:61217 stop:61795 length:579 start_codon:yes stop_codon:yes gene_type:complete